MKGIVHSLEARVRFNVRGPSEQSIEVEAVIDTGFSGWLTLPQATIEFLGLEARGPGRARLADGTEIVFDVFEANVIWDRRVRRIFIDEAEPIPLVGMSLLNGFELNMQVCPGGKVSIKPLAGRQKR